MQPPRVNVLGVGISAVNMAQAVSIIEGWIERGERRYVCVTGVHGIMECQRDARLRQVHNRSGLTTPDGMPMVWLSHLAGFRHVERVYGPDLMLELCRRSVVKGFRHFFYGGAPGVAEKLAARLTARFPGLLVVGTFTPPFRLLTEEEDAFVCDLINRAEPHFVWVGLSTPKQELWMAEHRGRLHAPVLIGVGAAFDFHSGRVRQAPRWMQRTGLEWMYRLAREPRRLWKRYLTNNPLFVVYVLMQMLRIRNFELIE